jgi:GDP-L-fucose synthase
MYSGARVLVAGGTGTIGIPLVNQLLDCGADVTIASLDSPHKIDLIFGRKSKAIKYKQLDLTYESNSAKAVRGQDIVFNLIGIKGSTGIGETKVASYLIPMLRFQTNLMEAAFKAKVKRFLFASSICAYPQSDLHFEDNLWQGMPKQNDRIPGIAKRVGELLGEAFQIEHGWDAVRVVRPSNVYGPFDDFDPRTAQVIPSIIAKAINNKKSINVWGDGSAVRDFIFNDDVAYWMLQVLERAPSNFPINLGSGEGVSIKQLVQNIIDNINPNCQIIWDPQAPSGDPVRLLSIDRAKETIDYYVRTSLNEGLIKTINWYKSQL